MCTTFVQLFHKILMLRVLFLSKVFGASFNINFFPLRYLSELTVSFLVALTRMRLRISMTTTRSAAMMIMVIIASWFVSMSIPASVTYLASLICTVVEFGTEKLCASAGSDEPLMYSVTWRLPPMMLVNVAVPSPCVGSDRACCFSP